MNILIVLILFYVSAASSQTCTSKKSELQIHKTCDIINKHNSFDFKNLSESLRSELVYDDCGLSSIIVFDITFPYTLRLHPLRPFLENTLKFSEVPQPYLENQFVHLSRLIKNSNQIMTLENYPTPLGLKIYYRTYWAKKCYSLDGKAFGVAAAQTKTTQWGDVGSNLSALTYEFLRSEDLLRVTKRAQNSVDYKNDFLSLSTAVALSSYKKISDAYKQDEDLTKNLLLSRIANEENFARLISEIDPAFYNNPLAIVGYLQSDIEHTLAVATLPESSFIDEYFKIIICSILFFIVAVALYIKSKFK